MMRRNPLLLVVLRHVGVMFALAWSTVAVPVPGPASSTIIASAPTDIAATSAAPGSPDSSSVSGVCAGQQQQGQDAAQRQVLVRDRVFSPSEVRRLHDAVQLLAYTVGEADFEGATPAGAVRDLDVELAGNPLSWSLEQQLVSFLLEKLQPLADRLLADRSLALLLESGVEAADRARTSRAPYRAYVNQFRRGDHPAAHRDAPLGSPHLTVLVYANREWKRDWGAETFFFTEARAPKYLFFLCGGELLLNIFIPDGSAFAHSQTGFVLPR
jgi:hypothetical protein